MVESFFKKKSTIDISQGSKYASVEEAYFIGIFGKMQ